MTNEEWAQKIVDQWDRFYRWRAEEHSPASGTKFPKLQEMIREALDAKEAADSPGC